MLRHTFCQNSQIKNPNYVIPPPPLFLSGLSRINILATASRQLFVLLGQCMAAPLFCLQQLACCECPNLEVLAVYVLIFKSSLQPQFSLLLLNKQAFNSLQTARCTLVWIKWQERTLSGFSLCHIIVLWWHQPMTKGCMNRKNQDKLCKWMGKDNLHAISPSSVKPLLYFCNWQGTMLIFIPPSLQPAIPHGPWALIPVWVQEYASRMS